MSRIPRIRRRAAATRGWPGYRGRSAAQCPAALATPGGGASMTAGTRS